MMRIFYYPYFLTRGFTVVYTSDWSAGNDLWNAQRAVRTANQDGIDGRDNCLQVYATADLGTHNVLRNNTVTVGATNRIRFAYYIPSGQLVNEIHVVHNNSVVWSSENSPLDEWVEVTTGAFTGVQAVLSIGMKRGSTLEFEGANSPTEDVFYLGYVIAEKR